MRLSWARVGCPVGLLGGSFAAFAASRWLFGSSKLLSWAPLSPHPGSRGALNSPQQLPRRPHGEADGPTKPPKLIWKRISIYFLMISEPKSAKKLWKKHSYGPFEAIIGYRVPIHSLPKLQEQRGGLRVSTLGSGALLPLAWSCLRRLESWFTKASAIVNFL